jgi:hypothetical protein
MKKMTVQQMVLLTFCLIAGMCAKKTVSTFANVITDFFRIPGGSLATGFSLAFLIFGTSLVPLPGSGTLMGIVQGMLSLILGMSGYQGAFCILTYMIPGITIDFCNKVIKKRSTSYFVITCSISNVVCSLFSNVLIFHLKGSAFILWVLMATVSGIMAGTIAKILDERLKKIIYCGGISA